MGKLCAHVKCTKHPRYGVAGTTAAIFCSGHAEDGMVDFKSKRCTHRGCTKWPTFGVAGTKVAEFCSGHAEDGMVNVVSKRCTHRGCTKWPTFGVAGTKAAEFCCGHAKDGMVDVRNKMCTHRGCTRQSRYGVAGTKVAEFCSEHAEDGMVDVVSKRCTHRGCTKHPSYGVAGTKVAEFCCGHAEDGMVDVRQRKRCTHRGCTKRPGYCVPGDAPFLCARQAEEGITLPIASNGQPRVHGLGGSTIRCGDAVEAGRIAIRVRPNGKKNTTPSPTQPATSTGRTEADGQRTRQAPFHTPATTTLPTETALDGGRDPVDEVSWTESSDDAVKTELALASSVDSVGTSEREAAAGDLGCGADCDSWCGGPGGEVKTEVGISLPSKRAAPGGQIGSRQSKRQSRATRRLHEMHPNS